MSATSLGWVIFLLVLLSQTHRVWRLQPRALGNTRQANPRPSDASMTRTQLRIRGLPPNTDKKALIRILQTPTVDNFRILPTTSTKSAGLDESTVVRSLTHTTDGRHCVATVQVPKIRRNTGQGQPLSGRICFEGQQISFDEELRDLTPLYWPKNWTVDIIAVTGLGGRPIASWQADDNDNMWLRDLLGPDLETDEGGARIFTYGYPSKLTKGGWDTTLREYAEAFLMNIKQARESQLKKGEARPLILIGHSFGGLVIKQALKIAQISKDEQYQDIARSCVCLVMFGVPNRGLDNDAFLVMTRGQRNEELVRTLGKESHYLEELDRDFAAIVLEQHMGRQMQVVVVYETEETHSYEENADGTWSRTGPKTCIVCKDSAHSKGLGSHAKSLISHTDHVQLAKLRSKDDPNYCELVGLFAAMAHDAKRDLISKKRIQVPDNRSPHFVGRWEVLDDMHEHFTTHVALNGDGDRARVFIVRGDTGMGTTEVGLQYIAAHAETYDKIVWVCSNSEGAIVQSFRSVAEVLGTEISRDPSIDVQSGLSRLSKACGKVLLIYDGLNDDNLSHKITTVHRPFWHSSMSVIITTSYDVNLSLGDPINRSVTLNALNPKDGVQFFRMTLGPEIVGSEVALYEFGEAIGWLPLALKEAVSYLKTKRYSVATFLDILKDDPINFFQQGTLSSSAIENPRVISVLSKSMARIHQSPSTSYAARFFVLCSFLGGRVDHDLFVLAHKFCQRLGECGHVTKPIEWLFPEGESWTPAKLHKALSSLWSLNLLQYQNGAWEQQPMIAELARRNSGERSEAFVIRAACFLHACAEELRVKEGGNANPDTTDVYYAQLRVAHHADVCVAFCRRVLRTDIAEVVPLECTVTFSIWNIHASKYKAAIKMLEAGLKQHFAQFDGSADGERKTIIKARRALAWAFRKDGQVDEAQKHQECAIQELQALSLKLFESSVLRKELIRAHGELATIYRDRGQFRTAIRLQFEVAREAEEIAGSTAYMTLHEWSCLSTIYGAADMLRESLNLDKKVLAVHNKHYPHRRPLRQDLERLRKMRLLAMTHYSLGEFDEAIALEMKVLERTQELRGERHVETAEALYNLAASCYWAGASRGWLQAACRLVVSGSRTNVELQNALKYIEQARSIRLEKLGRDDEETQKAYDLQEMILIA